MTPSTSLWKIEELGTRVPNLNVLECVQSMVSTAVFCS